jgi:hypothetical protein
MSEASTTESGPLSVDQAIAALMPETVEQDAPEAPVEAAEEPQEIEGEANAPEEPTEGAENPEDPVIEEPAEVAETPLDPPLYWTPEAKAKFAALDPEIQAEILAQEGPREASAAKAKAEAAQQTQAAQAEVAKVQQLADHLGSFLPQAIETFQNKWGNAPDWIAYANEYGAEAMMIAKVQHEQEFALLQQTAQATEYAKAQAREAQVAVEFQRLAEIAPDLADPVEGPKRRAEITEFLESSGLARDDIMNITANEMALAHDAMQWRKAQAALKARPTPKPTPAAAPRSPVRPAAAAPVPAQRTATQVANRFAQTRSVDDAVALLLARKA